MGAFVGPRSDRWSEQLGGRRRREGKARTSMAAWASGMLAGFARLTLKLASEAASSDRL